MNWRRMLAIMIALVPYSALADDVVSTGAVVSGTVTYTADLQRPWRYARYYVSDAKRGALAEAVVCLSQRGMKNFRPREAPQTVTMDQSDYRFIPETVAIRSGDQVRFTNSDPLLHNVMAVGGTEPLNVSLVRDSEHVQTFRRAGNAKSPVRIGCSLHSQMQAWIYVFDHPFFAVTEADGKFRFDDVPAGEYTLELMHPAGGLSWGKPIAIIAGETKTIDIRVSPDNKN